eukprot:490489_1
MELDWCFGCGGTFKDGTSGSTEAFKVEKLSNVDAMTVKCIVEETMDVSDENTYFEWKVSNHLIQQWKNAKYKKPFYSPSFNELYLAICPNGHITEGSAYLCLMSHDEKETHFGYYIGIESFNHYDINFKENKI